MGITEVLAFRIHHREVYGGGRVSHDHLAGFQLAIHIHTRHRLWGLDGLVGLCLSRQCNEGKQGGNDSLLHKWYCNAAAKIIMRTGECL